MACKMIFPQKLNAQSAIRSNSFDFLGNRFSTHSVQFKRNPVPNRGAVTVTASSSQEHQTTAFALSKRKALAVVLSGCVATQIFANLPLLAEPSIESREYTDIFDGYTLQFPKSWIQVKGAGADIFFRDPFVLDENVSVNISSPSSSTYKSVEDLGTPQQAGKNVAKQYLTEFMSTRLGVRREANIVSTASKTADDGKLYYQIEVNIKSYANNNELAVMPEDRVVQLEWNRRYLSVLGVENNRLYELRLQVPERVFQEEESDLRKMMDSFRVNKV